MRYDDLIQALIRTGHNGWIRNDERSVFTLKTDVNVTVRESSRTRDGEPQPFTTEEWATNFPDGNAQTEVFELWYGASFVNEYHFAAVDGFRARLPYPSIEDLTITEEQHAIAVAVDLHG